MHVDPVRSVVAVSRRARRVQLHVVSEHHVVAPGALRTREEPLLCALQKHTGEDAVDLTDDAGTSGECRA